METATLEYNVQFFKKAAQERYARWLNNYRLPGPFDPGSAMSAFNKSEADDKAMVRLTVDQIASALETQAEDCAGLARVEIPATSNRIGASHRKQAMAFLKKNKVIMEWCASAGRLIVDVFKKDFYAFVQKMPKAAVKRLRLSGDYRFAFIGKKPLRLSDKQSAVIRIIFTMKHPFEEQNVILRLINKKVDDVSDYNARRLLDIFRGKRKVWDKFFVRNGNNLIGPNRDVQILPSEEPSR